MGFNSAFKGLKLLKNPGNKRLNNLNDPVLNVLTFQLEELLFKYIKKCKWWRDIKQGSFEMWCWWRMEKISRTDRVRNEEGLQRVKEEKNILPSINKKKDNWICHILRMNCLLKHVVEGKPEGEKWRGDKEEDVSSYWMTLRGKKGYWKLKGEGLDRILCSTRFGRGNGPVLRQTTEWMKTE